MRLRQLTQASPGHAVGLLSPCGRALRDQSDGVRSKQILPANYRNREKHEINVDYTSKLPSFGTMGSSTKGDERESYPAVCRKVGQGCEFLQLPLPSTAGASSQAVCVEAGLLLPDSYL